MEKRVRIPRKSVTVIPLLKRISQIAGCSDHALGVARFISADTGAWNENPAVLPNFQSLSVCPQLLRVLCF